MRSLPAPGEIASPPGDWTITADAQSLGVVIADTGGRTLGASLDIGTWQSTIGAWSVDLVGDPAALFQRIAKGQRVVHEVSLGGGAWEPVQSGVVHDYSADDTGRGRLECLDPTAMLRSRTTTTADELPLFAGFGLTDAEDEDGLTAARATLAESYEANDQSTLLVAGVTPFTYADTSGGRLATIGPLGARRFYYRYTGTSGTQTLTGGTDDVYGTRARYNAGDDWAQVVPFVEDHPLDIARKILCSTGSSSDTPTTPANGTYDTLPRTWGFAVPDWLIDHDDIDQWKPRLTPASGASDWTMITEYVQPDGLAYLQSWLARAGLFITHRQGRLTVRGVVDPDGMSEASESGSTSMGYLSGADVVPGSLRWSAWDGTEYSEVRAFTATHDSAVSGAVKTFPNGRSYWVDLRDTIWSNESAHQALICARLAPWLLTIPERLEIDVVHPLARGLAPGDVVRLDFPHWGGRDVASEGPYDGRYAMVTRVDPDWWGDAPTRLVLATPPRSWWVS